MNKILLLSALLLTTSAAVVNDLKASAPATAIQEENLYSLNFADNVESLYKKCKKHTTNFLNLADVSIPDLYEFIEISSKNKAAFLNHVQLLEDYALGAGLKEKICCFRDEKIRELDSDVYTASKNLLNILLQNITKLTISNILKADTKGEIDRLLSEYLSHIEQIKTSLTGETASPLNFWKRMELLGAINEIAPSEKAKIGIFVDAQLAKIDEE